MFQAAPLLVFVALLPSLAKDPPRTDVRRWEHETSDLAPDARIHFGALPNGLRYAWMDNSEPKKRCYLRLHVDVGSMAEEDSERGMAHYLEHMAFNGSKRFPAGSLVEWFQRHGMSFGADTNALTDFSQTVYELDLPVSDEKTLTEGLQVLRDYADGLMLEPKEIDAERGVIDGEERERDSAGLRLLREVLRLQFSGSRVADRLPIGTKEARDKFDAEAIRKFYSTWYRPETMTLLVVGDLEGKSPVPLIEKEFAGLAKPATPVRAEPPAGKLDMTHRVYAVHEPELPAFSIGIQMATPFRDKPDNKAEAAAELPIAAAAAMLNVRFNELRKGADAPFLSASLIDSRSGMEDLGIRVQEGLLLSISCTPDKWKEAITVCEQELRRALEFGFEEPELAETRANYTRVLDESVAREKSRPSSSWMQALLDAAENRSVPVSAATQRDVTKPLLDALDVEACRKALAKAWNAGELVIGVGGPLDLGADGPKALMEVYEKSRAVKVEPRAKKEDKDFAYASDASKAGEIAERSKNEEFDFHTVTFANGVRLHVKATDFVKKQIVVAVRLGEGELSIDAKDLPLSKVASGVLEGCGLVAHSQDELRRLNAGKRVGHSFEVSADSFHFNGATSREDLVRELELLTAQLREPGWRSEGMIEFHKKLAVSYENLKHQHGGALWQHFLPAIHSGDPRHAWIEEAALKAITPKELAAWLEPQFARAPIDVVLVGDLDVEETVAAVARTFGRLDKRRSPERHEERRKPMSMTTGFRKTYSVDTTVPKTLVFIAFPTTDGREAATRRNLQFLSTVLNDRLRIEVREKLGASYSPAAGATSSEVIPNEGIIGINAMSDPEQVEALVEACLSAAAKLATDGVTKEEVDRLRAPEIAAYRDALRTNRFWGAALARIHTQAAAIEDLRTSAKFFEEVSPEALTPLAKKYLSRERANIAIVTPATTKATAEAPAETKANATESSAPVKKE